MTRESANGQVFICDVCKQIHLEFNGIRIDFQKFDLLMAFYDYIDSMDAAKIEKNNTGSQFRRKITVFFPKTNLKLLLTPGELDELKRLIRSFISDYVRNKGNRKTFKALNIAKDLPAIYLN